MLSATALLVACGSAGSKQRSPSGPATTGGGGATGTATTIDVPGVNNGHMSDDDVQRLVTDYAGQWLGSWADDAGGTGTAEVAVAIDTSTRVVDVDVRSGGPIVLGTAPAPAAYRFPLDGFVDVPDTYTLPSVGFGTVGVRVEGFGQCELRSTSVPGHPDIEVFDLKVIVGPANHAATTYKITETSGKTVLGAIAFARGAVRLSAPQVNGANAMADLLSGATAAALVTTDELTAAVGRAMGPPSANGGKAEFAPGVTASNSLARSADGTVSVQWTLFRGSDRPSIQAFWHNYDTNQSVSGIGDDAKEYSLGLVMLYVLRGTDSLQLQIDDPAKAGNQIQAEYLAVARAMVARMGGS